MPWSTYCSYLGYDTAKKVHENACCNFFQIFYRAHHRIQHGTLYSDCTDHLYFDTIFVVEYLEVYIKIRLYPP